MDPLCSTDRRAIESRMGLLLDRVFAPDEAPLRDAVRAFILGGGKRLRPQLCLWTLCPTSEMALIERPWARATAT